VRRIPENARLLFGPYEPPPLQKGDRATCYYRDADVVITSWSDGRISWPRCRALGARGGSGLLVEEELARAIRSESAAALMYWWGVGPKAVWRWRQALGVSGWTATEGTRRLHRAAAAKGGAGMQARGLTDRERRQRRKRARALDLGRHREAARAERAWPAGHLALLGTMPDDEMAARTGRSENAARVKRTKLGIPTFCDRRRVTHGGTRR
jgi:hypothetical protein